MDITQFLQQQWYSRRYIIELLQDSCIKKNKEIISFLIIGIASVLIDASLYFIFSDYFLLNINISKGMSFVAGATFGFFCNKNITFLNQNQYNFIISLILFIILYAITLSINILINYYSLTFFLFVFLGIWHNIVFSKIIAFLLATSISTVLNYLGMKFIVFKKLNK